MSQQDGPIDRLRGYLRQLTPQARSRLLAELERLQLCGDDIPGSEVLLTELRAEFRREGQTFDRVGNPSRYFFQAVEPMLVDRAPEHANSGQISRASLSAIWEWISRNLMPTMARDYAEKMRQVIVANNPREAQQLAATFQNKALKYLEGTLASGNGAAHTRAGLAIYTSSRATYDDLLKIVGALRARDPLLAFNEALPLKIDKFDGERLAKVRSQLDAFAAKNPDAVPFALTIVARRLKTPWQLIGLATNPAGGKDAGEILDTPYALAVSMVLDQLDDKRLALRKVLQSDRIPIAKDILAEIYDIEDALRARIDPLGPSDWVQRLDDLMAAVAHLLETEVRNIPENLQHVLAPRLPRHQASLGRRLSHLAGKGRNALTGSAAFCKGLVGLGQRHHG